ncbi:acetyl-CoA synthetase-like protein [Xylaria grammica]|nr:acetyl-CoA synthetase-like protein [Xylaria grammica]
MLSLNGDRNGKLETCSTNREEDSYDKTGVIAMLMLTSGSTGSPKAVQFTHKQILTAVAGKAAVHPPHTDRPFLNWIGLDHVAGLTETHLLALSLGVDQVHVSAADIVPSPRIFLDLPSRHRVSRTFAPNFFLAKLVSTIDVAIMADNEWDLTSLGCVVSGGEGNDVKTCAAASALFEKYGASPNVITTGFGITETCAGCMYNENCPAYDISQGYSIASVGKCIRGIKMRIVTLGSLTCLAVPGESGDLQVSGPVVFEGYYRNPAATKQAFTPDGWFQTRDLGMIDSNGNLNLVGRSKEVININGVKAALADIQQAIEAALGNRVARVVAFPSKNLYNTEQVTIAYIPKLFPMRDEDMAAIAQSATQACLLSTATCPLVFPRLEQSLPQIPISTLGKISPSKVARLFESGAFVRDIELHERAIRRAREHMRACDAGLATETEAQLIEDVAEVLDASPHLLNIHAGTSIFGIGFNLMHIIKLKYRIEKRLGLDLPIVNIIKNPSVRALAANINAQPHRRQPLSPEQSPSDFYDPVVVLRAGGTKTPLWLVHPGVGEILVFVRLAQHLAVDKRPLFALRAAGLEPGRKQFSSITEIADVYTAAI